MKNETSLLSSGICVVQLLATDGKPAAAQNVPKLVLSEAAWKERLSPEAFRVLRRQGTEPAFCGLLVDLKEDGVYLCAGCQLPLFSSIAKFHSGTGWPSFFQPFAPENVIERTDGSLDMERTEIRCARCDGHLGHVFDDGPAPTGKRYCLNSVSLTFLPLAQIAAAPVLARADSAPKLEKATFAAGCFWGVEAEFRAIPGVVETQVGFTGGKTEQPTYKQVCAKDTGHAEAVEVTYDPAVVSYATLLEHFWEMHDPTQLHRQGPDVGSQYRSAIFWHTPAQRDAAEAAKRALDDSKRLSRPVVTEIVPAVTFWRAEEYHQRYLEKNGRLFCH